jgi:acetyltransferase
MVSSERIIALDARVVLHEVGVDLTTIPKAAIRPYPIQYISKRETKKNLKIDFRPIRPEDEPMMIKFHERLSERSVYLRYLSSISLNQRTDHKNLMRNCFIDYDREMAIVAIANDEILGVSRMKKSSGRNDARIAILVSDSHQGHGLGTELVRKMIKVAHDEKLSMIRADILSENINAISMMEKLGFKIRTSDNKEVVHAEYII